jgi:hypothetical protein
MYRPLRVFSVLGSALILLGMLPGIRFLHFIYTGRRVGHVQSLILASILIIVGFQVLLIGLLADLLSRNRKLLEEVIYRVRKLDIMPETPRNDRDCRREDSGTPRNDNVCLKSEGKTTT